MARELKRLNINLPQELVDKVDEYADNLCIQRTTAITVLLNTALNQQDGIKALQDLMNAYNEEKNGQLVDVSRVSGGGEDSR
jgi:metal-responsive CopG/Arc/MetJ family transcriptional regulator